VSIELQALDASFARQVHGLNLWDLLDERSNQSQNRCGTAEEELRSAFNKHPVLVFRRQCLSEDELLTLGRVLGKPAEYVERSWHSSKPEVSIVSNMRNSAGDNIGGLSSKELNWHTDQSYNATPVTGCFLYAQVVPNDGSRTSWASLYAGYESLQEETKSRIELAIGIFSYAARTGAVITGDKDEQIVQQSYSARIEASPDVRHPLVNKHPRSGRKSLYIDPGTLIGIDGMSTRDSAPLLAQLQQAATCAANVYHHQWQLGDLVLWDNAVTLHRRDAFADKQTRLLKRMIIDLPADTHIIPAQIC
jgi:taurine dioxygenase